MKGAYEFRHEPQQRAARLPTYGLSAKLEAAAPKPALAAADVPKPRSLAWLRRFRKSCALTYFQLVLEFCAASSRFFLRSGVVRARSYEGTVVMVLRGGKTSVRERALRGGCQARAATLPAFYARFLAVGTSITPRAPGRKPPLGFVAAPSSGRVANYFTQLLKQACGSLKNPNFSRSLSQPGNIF